MRRARNAGLVLCLFTLYCVLLSQGLKANALSTLFGALAAVPLTVHLYRRVLPAAVGRPDNRAGDRALPVVRFLILTAPLSERHVRRRRGRVYTYIRIARDPPRAAR